MGVVCCDLASKACPRMYAQFDLSILMSKSARVPAGEGCRFEWHGVVRAAQHDDRMIGVWGQEVTNRSMQEGAMRLRCKQDNR